MSELARYPRGGIRMINAYHRPHSLAEALSLITRSSPVTLPLGGGTLLAHGMPEAVEVVDLQELGLDQVKTGGKSIEIGATTTLQRLVENPSLHSGLRSAAKQESPLNLRNSATAAGTIVACNGRSTFTAALLALDARITLLRPEAQTIELGDLLPVRNRVLPRALITSIEIPTNVQLAFEYVARTPVDSPIVCAALARWPSGRTRLALGGYGPAPLLAMDGTESEGLETAARNAFHEATDPWGSAEYRMDVAATLARRCLAAVTS